MASKYPQLEEMRDKMLAEKAEIEAKSAPLREERAKLREQIAPAMDRIRELDKLIHATEMPKLREINSQLVGITKACGPKKE